MKRPLSLALSFAMPLFLLFLVWSAFVHIERVAAHPMEPADTQGGDATLDGQQDQSHVMLMTSEVITAYDDTYETDEDVPLFVSASGVLTNDVNTVSGTLSALFVTPPAFGDAYLNLDGSFSYLPPLNFNGVTTFTYQAAILEDFADMVAYWALDDLPSTTAYDYSGNGHLGTLMNGAAWVTDTAVTTFHNPYALALDGLDDYVTIPDDPALDFGASDDFSVALWVKIPATQLDATNTDNSIVEKWSGSGGYPYVIRYLNQTAGADNGKIQVVRYDGINVPVMHSNATVNDNQYHHVAFVKNGANLELYIDGVLDNSTPDTTTFNPSNSSPLFLGQRGGGTNRFQGTLDDLRIYDRSLSLDEVAQLAQGNHLGEISNTAVVTITVNPALVVNSLSPAANSHTAPLTTTLSAGFNFPISPTSVTSQSLTVHSNMSGRTSGMITSTMDGMNFDPASPFFPGELVESTILTNVLDTEGDPLLYPYVWQFRTGAGVGPAVFADNGDNFGDRWTDASALGDVDRDGDLDLIAIYSEFMFVWANSGNGTYTFDNVYYLNYWYATAVALGDLDGDGDLDIFVSLFGSPDEVWLNDGGLQGGTVGNFTSSGQQLGSDFSTDVALGDLDGDGDLDAFVAVQGGSSRVWLNDGTGTFTDSGYNLGSHNISDVALGDVDNDGDLDVFVSIYGGANRVWLNNGAGVFFDSGQSLGTGYSTGVALGDVDGDGDLDAFVTNIAIPSNSQVWLNNGNGSFSDSGQTLPIGYGVALGDFDGDGDLDAFVIDTGPDRVLLNNGAGQFTDSGQSLDNVQSQTISLGDVDGDGDLDAFVGNIHYDKVWLNRLSASLSLQKSASSNTVIPGEMITYTLTYANGGPHTATNVILTDTIPASLDSNTLAVISSGAQITPVIGSSYVWQVADLAPGNGGVITITGAISNPLTAGSFSNQVTITTDVFETNTSDNVSTVTTHVAEVPPVAQDDVYTTTENISLTVSAVSGVMQNDYDLNGNALTAVLGTTPSTGSLEFNADGSFVYTPTLDFNGSVTFTYQLAAAENPAMMTGYWTMDDNALTASDSSGHGHTAWLLDGSSYITDPTGHWTADTAATSFPNPYALVFDGINDWGVIASQPDFNFGPDDDFAVAFWLKADTTQADAGTFDNMLVSKYSYIDNSSVFAITLLNQTSGVRDGRILVSRSDGANIPFIESTATVNDNQYHHIAFVKNGDVLSLYIDGILEGTTTDTTTTPAHATVSHIYLGKLENNTRYFQGALDDLRIYGRGLSATQVAQLAMGNNAPQFSQTAVVTINVTPVNETPIAADDSYTTMEDTPLNVAVPGVLGNDIDGDGDSLTAVLDTNVTTGTLSLNSNGSFTYTPPANWSGVTTFSYHANDGQANSNTAVVTLTVTAVNDAPIAVNDAYTTTEDTLLTVAASGVLTNDTDVEGDALTAVLDTDVTSGTLNLNSDGSFTYSPDADFCGTDGFTYYANDGQDNSSPATVTLTVTCVNDAPIANDDTAATDEDTAIDIAVLDNDVDVDGDDLTVTAVSTPATGSTSTDGTTITYTPVNLVAGYTAVFTYTISDGSLTDSATVTITITADNDAPTAVNDLYSVPEDSSDNTLTILDNDSDPDGDDFITLWTVGTPDQGGTAVLSGNTILYTPAPDFVGTETFTYTIHDMPGLTDTATVTIDVDNENDAPTAVDDSYTVNENSSDNIFTVLDNDSDIDVGDSLSISEVSSPVNGAAVISGTIVLYTPTPDFFGTDTFTYTIQDLGGLMDTATVTVTVEAVNNAPTAVDDSYTVAENSSDNIFTVLDNDSDIDVGDSLSISSVSSPVNGTAVISGTIVLYTPTPDFFGTDTFTYTIEDTGGLMDTATVTVTVEAVNNAPTAVDDSYTVNENSSDNVFDVLTNDSDIDGDSLSIVSVEGVGNGTAVISGTTILYTPAPGFSGTDTFTYTISDGLLTATATVTVSVTPMQTGFTIYLPMIIKP